MAIHRWHQYHHRRGRAELGVDDATYQELKMTVVLDLDGTLNNCDHRQQHARNGDWNKFHSALMDDEPNPDVLWFVRMIEEEHPIIGCTGRNEAFRPLTYKWLDRHKIKLDAILMRPDGDYTPDAKLKPAMLEEFFRSKEEVLKQVRFVVDDRDRVVEAWRNYGLFCWQCRPGSY
jgi:histidinol phosphatase-like enzyme